VPASPPGKIAARRAAVGQEQAVADEHRIADAIAHAVRRVARRGDRLDRQPPWQAVAVGEQAVELRAVGGEPRAEPVHGLERALHRADALADADRRAGAPSATARADRWSACACVSRIHRTRKPARAQREYALRRWSVPVRAPFAS
jgi:hypothetical protein